MRGFVAALLLVAVPALADPPGHTHRDIFKTLYDASAQQRAADDCSAETDGATGELCIDNDGTGIWYCPSPGDCSGTTAWVRRDDVGATASEANDISDHETRLGTLETEVSGTHYTAAAAPVDGSDACEIGDTWADSSTPSFCHCTNAGTDTWACVTTTE